MAAAVGVGEVMRRSREDKVLWVREEHGRARLRHLISLSLWPVDGVRGEGRGVYMVPIPVNWCP